MRKIKLILLVIGAVGVVGSSYLAVSEYIEMYKVKKSFAEIVPKVEETKVQFLENFKTISSNIGKDVVLVLDKTEIYDLVDTCENIEIVNKMVMYRKGTELVSEVLEDYNHFLNIQTSVESISYVVTSSDLLEAIDSIQSLGLNIKNLIVDNNLNQIMFTVNMFSEGVLNVLY